MDGEVDGLPSRIEGAIEFILAAASGGTLNFGNVWSGRSCRSLSSFWLFLRMAAESKRMVVICSCSMSFCFALRYLGGSGLLFGICGPVLGATVSVTVIGSILISEIASRFS